MIRKARYQLSAMRDEVCAVGQIAWRVYQYKRHGSRLNTRDEM
jgi:hypothetical protein